MTGLAEGFVEQDIPKPAQGGGYRASADGTLVHLSGGWGVSSLVWVDRPGREEPGCGGVAGEDAVVSPDGRSLAVDLVGAAVGILDLGDCSMQELPVQGRTPSWSPDGRRIAVTGDGLRRMNADGTGRDSLVVRRSGPFNTDWSPDGRTLYLAETTAIPDGQVTNNRLTTASIPLWRLDVASGGADTLGGDGLGLGNSLPTVSPDGRWIAFGEWDGLRREIHVVRVEGDRVSDARRVASDGAYAPMWNRRGGELFFRRRS